MKKLIPICLALTMTLSVSAAALGAEGTMRTAPAGKGYAYTLTVNGSAADVTGLPGGTGIPMRTLCESDYGFADWYPDENRGFFSLDGNSIYVDFSNGNALEVNGQAVTGYTAQVIGGVTFLPAAVINSLNGYTAVVKDGAITVTTPNGDPMVKLARNVMEVAGVGNGMKSDVNNYGIDSANFTKVTAFFPMMTSPDTVIIGQVADGKMDAVKEDLEAYRQSQEDTFSWYLTQNLPKVENARVEVSGNYILFLIGEDADAGVQAFLNGVKNL